MELAKDALQLTVGNVTFVRTNLSLEGREYLNSVACREGANGLNSCAVIVSLKYSRFTSSDTIQCACKLCNKFIFLIITGFIDDTRHTDDLLSPPEKEKFEV